MAALTREYIEERSIGRRNEDRLVRDRIRKYDQIFKVGQIITSEVNLDTLFEVIMTETNQILGTRRSTVFLHDKRTGELWSLVATGMKRNEIRIPDSYGVAGWVFTHIKPLMINDAYNDPRFYSEIDKKSGFRTRNIFCVPLLNRQGECIGALQALNKVTGRFTERDRDLLTSISCYVAIALENAKLYEELKALDRARERVINHLSHELKTPIAIISAALGRVSREVRKENVSKLERAVERCDRNLHRLMDLQEKIDAGEFVLPKGVNYTFAGTYENQIRAQKTLTVVVPLALFIIFIILYLQFRSVSTTTLVFSGIAVAWAGGFLLIWLYGRPWFLDFHLFGVNMRQLFQVQPINLSVAIWVGFLALFGIASDDGVVMSTYLEQSFRRRSTRTKQEVRRAVIEAGSRRVRPCLMTTATTILALSAIRALQADESLPENARKLLSFTDNRQDASLQAGHFNDFVEVGLLRSALYKAAVAAGSAGLRHDELVQRVFDALDLPLELYASNPTARFQALEETKRALRSVLGYRLYRDLKRGWRVTTPNLEQCGLIEIRYLSLEDVCGAADLWEQCHPALATASKETRMAVARTLLDFMRRELAIKVDYLDPLTLERIQQQSSQRLKAPWALDENEKPEYAAVLYPRSRRRGDHGGDVYLSSRGGFGQYLRRSQTLPDYGERLSLAETEDIIKHCLLYTSPSPRDLSTSRMPSSA